MRLDEAAIDIYGHMVGMVKTNTWGICKDTIEEKKIIHQEVLTLY